MDRKRHISVIGLGYVGLPAAVAFAQNGYRVTAFDIDSSRIQELEEGFDRTNEVTAESLQSPALFYTSDSADLYSADFHIITVPTPINTDKTPDFSPLKSASRTLGPHLKTGSIVVYESTVYPGATEEICVPVLEETSGLRFGSDFFVGYSPERINPGDALHRFETITKVVAGSDEQTLGIIAGIYGSVITAGIHKAPNIKTAEAAKVIENTQRDLNIALMNELAVIFGKLDIDTQDVLAAAGTKWNFLPFTPGLVGGHCIGVDPYYLTHRAKEIGHDPNVILAGRNINDSMADHVAGQVVSRTRFRNERAVVTVLGITFKEGVPDIRNTKVIDLINCLKGHGCEVQVFDPVADSRTVETEYGLTLSSYDSLKPADSVVLAVPHTELLGHGWAWIQGLLKDGCGMVADIKAVLPRKTVPHGIDLWRL